MVSPETIKLSGGSCAWTSRTAWTGPTTSAVDRRRRRCARAGELDALGPAARRRGRLPAADDGGARGRAGAAARRCTASSRRSRRRRRRRARTSSAIARDHAEAAAAAALVAADDGAWRLDWPAADPRRVRFAVAVDAVALLADEARLARVRRCPGPRLRLAVPRHQRPAPLVLDGDVRQPGEDAPPLRAPPRRRSRCRLPGHDGPAVGDAQQDAVAAVVDLHAHEVALHVHRRG